MAKKKEEPIKRKCYACRTELPAGSKDLFCKACERKPESRVHQNGVLKIYHKM